MAIWPTGLGHAVGVFAVPGGNALPASIDSWKTAPCRSSTLRYANLNRLDLSDDASPASRHRRRTGQEDAAKSLVHHRAADGVADRSEEHTSELQSLMRISYAVFCLKKQINTKQNNAH